ncbi:phosphotransferase [Allonocardiopsis opalescens]|nr:phosphotransferase [Allonocardiopsis opalescens]
MEQRPTDLHDDALRECLADWGIDAATLAYAPVGFGDHHWTAVGSDGRRWFVTVADLAHKWHCGATPPDAYQGLRRAMDTAAALREAGLEFVVAPVRTAGGGTVRPLGERYAVSVFPFLDGSAGAFGERLGDADRRLVIDVLAELHRQPPPGEVPVPSPQPSARAGLERALAELGEPWHGGPFAERSRALFADRAEVLRRSLAAFDRLAADVAADGPVLVVTHGEPHSANLLRQDGGFRLLDWDTVGLAVPERDLWQVAEGSDDLARYAEATGRRPDPLALELYRRRWALEDVAEYAAWFRAPHGRTPDTELAWNGLVDTLDRLGEDDQG